jgi:hypothetical protein
MENIFCIVFNREKKSLVKVRSHFAFETFSSFDSTIVKIHNKIIRIELKMTKIKIESRSYIHYMLDDKR